MCIFTWYLTVIFVDITVQVLDVTKSDAVKAFAEKIDKCDVLFNCAGFVLLFLLTDIDIIINKLD